MSKLTLKNINLLSILKYVIVILITILVYSLFNVSDYGFDTKIKNKQKELDSITNVINKSLELDNELKIRIDESKTKSLEYEKQINELQKEYDDVEPIVKSKGVSYSYDVVYKHLESLRTNNKTK